MRRDLELQPTKHDPNVDIKSYLRIAFRNGSSVYLVTFNGSSSWTETTSIEKVEKMVKMMMIFVRTTQMIVVQDISEKSEDF
jgi:hypothetical protein